MRLPDGLRLAEDENGLCLLSEDGLSLRADFRELIPRLRYHNLTGELIVKAAKIRGQETVRVLDATAGFGEDSFLLAASGCQVDLYEYDPVIAALLKDALRRALADDALKDTASRMCLHEEDSIQAMQALAQTEDSAARDSAVPDVVFLDPMFPERRKSGLIGKKFQLLQRLEKPCSDEEALLNAALMLHPKKIVVKRPLKGPYLAGRKPDYSLSGKAVRYDVILSS